jgi:hypothetical protein
LMFITSGFAVIAYLIIWVVAPLATTSAERAAVSGAGTTAADVTRRVRESARPALASVGEALRRIGAVVRPVLYGLTVVLLFSIGLAYGWAVAEQMAGSLNIISGVSENDPWWLVQLWLAAAVWLVAAPVFLVNRLCRKPSERRPRISAAMLTVSCTAWFAALLVLFTVPLANSSQLRSLAVEGSGRIMLGGDEYCVATRGERRATPSDAAQTPVGCQPDDRVIYIDAD